MNSVVLVHSFSIGRSALFACLHHPRSKGIPITFFDHARRMPVFLRRILPIAQRPSIDVIYNFSVTNRHFTHQPLTARHPGAAHSCASNRNSLTLPNRPTAVFCSDDAIASYAVRAALDAGLRVPCRYLPSSTHASPHNPVRHLMTCCISPAMASRPPTSPRSRPMKRLVSAASTFWQRFANISVISIA